MIWKGRNKNHIYKVSNKFDLLEAMSPWPKDQFPTPRNWCHNPAGRVLSHSRGENVCHYQQVSGQGSGLLMGIQMGSEHLAVKCLITHKMRSSFSNLSPSFISVITRVSQEKRNHTKILLAQVVTWRVVKMKSNFHSHKIS